MSQSNSSLYSTSSLDSSNLSNDTMKIGKGSDQESYEFEQYQENKKIAEKTF